MGYHDIRLRRSDTLFSGYVRELHGWRCERCGKLCRIDGNWIGKLEASHYYSRSHWSVRHDTRNVRSLCFTCHKRMGGHTKNEDGEYDLWMKELLGDDGYRELRIAANAYAKRDEAMALLYVRSLIEQTEGGGRMKRKPKPKGC